MVKIPILGMCLMEELEALMHLLLGQEDLETEFGMKNNVLLVKIEGPV